ncbi:MAG: hypothetical protein M0Z27_13530 [Thermaerobacter sp.]|nr:hypothetical protein [Thermaerobacter sp.]
MRAGCLAVVLAGMLLLVSGCWDMTAVDDRNMVAMLALNRRAGEWTVRAQVLLPRYFAGAPGTTAGGGNGGRTPPFTVLSGRGGTFLAAMQSMEDRSNRLFDYSLLKVVVLGRGLVREGLRRVDPLLRDVKLPPMAYVGVAREGTDRILEAQAVTESLPSHYLYTLFSRQGNRTGAAMGVMLWQFMRHRFGDGDAFAPGLTVGRHGLRVDGLALFRGGRFAGWLDPRETATFDLVRRGYPHYQVSAQGPPTVSLRVIGGRATYGVRLRRGEPRLWVRVGLRGNLAEAGRSVRTVAQADRAQSLLASALRLRVRRLVARLQKLDTDPIGFREKLREQEPHSPFLREWGRIYPKLDVSVRVRVNEVRQGFIF